MLTRANVVLEKSIVALETAHQVSLELDRLCQEAGGLTFQQTLVLAQIDVWNGRGTTSGLAFALGRASNTMTGIVDNLARKGLIERHRDVAADRRVIRLKTTLLGEETLIRFRASTERIMALMNRDPFAARPTPEVFRAVDAIGNLLNLC